MCILHYITYLLLILRQTIHSLFFFFFFNDTATTEIYTLSLHDALPISLLLIGLLFFLRPGSARSEIKHAGIGRDRKSTRLNSSHGYISYAVFCLKKKKKKKNSTRRKTNHRIIYYHVNILYMAHLTFYSI